MDQQQYTNEKKRIGKNIISLALVNGATLLTPLLLIPYLIRVIGTEGYGIYIFSWTLISYFTIIVNYGYDYYATREIATHREQTFISKLFYEVTASRLILALVCVVVVICCSLLIPKLQPLKLLIILGIGVFLGQSIHPTWLFQGMEEMGFITIITLLTRIIPIILVYIFVKNIEQSYLVMLFQSIGYIIGGVISSIMAIKRYDLNFHLPDFAGIWAQTKASWTLFCTTLGITLYRETNVVILGIVSGNYVLVGYYSIADKFIRLSQMAITPVIQAMFPYFGKKFKSSNSAYETLRKSNIILSVYLVLLLILAFASAPFFVNIYVGETIPEVVTNIRIMSPIILFSGYSCMIGVAGLVNIGREKSMMKFVMFTGVINIILCTLLSRALLDVGASISITASEMILCTIVFRDFLRTKKQYEGKTI